MTAPPSSGEPSAAVNRSATAAFNRAFNDGDVEGYLAFLDPEVEYQSVTAASEATVYRGLNDVREYLRSLPESFAQLEVETLAHRRIADGVLVAHARWRVRGRGSGVELESPLFNAVVLREGKITVLHAFTNETDAVADAERLAAEHLPQP
jgi:uncharacterized protein